MTDELHYTNANAGQWVKAMADIESDPPMIVTNWQPATDIGTGYPIQVSESAMDDIDRLFFDLRKLKKDYAEACADRDRARLAEARVGEIAGEIERKMLELGKAVRGLTV